MNADEKIDKLISISRKLKDFIKNEGIECEDPLVTISNETIITIKLLEDFNLKIEEQK